MSTNAANARLSSFYFAYYAALGAFTPYWSVFLKDRGQDVAAISVLMSLWYATRIIAPSTWGWLAGRSPRPARWLRFGCAATLASFLVFLAPLDFTALFVAMCVFCFFYNAVMPQFEALTLSHLTGRSERYGRIRVWGSVGFIAVVATFGCVFDHLPVTTLPWLMLPLYAALLGSSWLNDYGPGHFADQPRGGFAASLRRREVLAFFLVAFLIQVAFGPYYTFFSLYLQEHGYRHSALGLYWAIGVGVEIIIFFLSSHLFVRWTARGVVLLALFSAVVRWWVTALFADNVVVMVLAQMTHALNFAGFYTACMQLMVRYFPGRLGGHGQGVFYGFSSGAGGVLGALIAGQAWRIGGGELAFLLASGISAIAWLVAWRELDPRRIDASAAP